jgi:putative transposase
MKYDPGVHSRRSIRLQGYDYSQAGAYFVTICTQNRERLFGDIVDGKMALNDAGTMI